MQSAPAQLDTVLPEVAGPHGRVCRRRHLTGFTLIEVLVAISIMAILAVMSWRGLDAMTTAQHHTRQRADTMQALQAGLGQWKADWDALIPWPGTPALDWNGKALRMLRPSAGSVADGVIVVAWSTRNIEGVNHWLRWQSPVLHGREEIESMWLRAGHWAQNPTEDEQHGEVAITPLVDWQMFYFRDKAWGNPFSSVGTAESRASAIPEGVRLILTLLPGQELSGTLTRDWARITVGGGKS